MKIKRSDSSRKKTSDSCSWYTAKNSPKCCTWQSMAIKQIIIHTQIFTHMEKKENAGTINALFASLPVWNITELNGYEPKTTFWMDFSIADHFGADAVQDTFNRAFAAWKTNTVYLTEMVLVLNHKIWQHYNRNDELTVLYDKLWRQADGYALAHLKDNDLSYYYQTTD